MGRQILGSRFLGFPAKRVSCAVDQILLSKLYRSGLYQVNIDMHEALYAACCTSSEQGLGFGSCSTVWVRGHKVLQHPPSTLKGL